MSTSVFSGKIKKCIDYCIQIAVIFSFFLPAAAHAIRISPLKQTVSVEPGQEQIIRLEVKNDEDRAMTVTPSIEAFSIDSNGSPVFGKPDVALSWVRAEQHQRALDPGQTKTFVFAVRVPKNAEPGGRYLALFANRAGETGQISLGARAGSLITIIVAGDVREEMRVERFSPSKKIVWNDRISFHLALKNVGTIHVTPRATIHGGGMFSEVGFDAESKKEIGMVLPEGTIEASFPVSDLSWRHIGRNRVTSYVRYGETRQRLLAETVFWYIPLFVPLFLLAITVLVGVYMRRYKMKKYVH